MRARRWRVVCFVLAALSGITGASADTPEELFDRGNAAYDAGRFEEAADAYRSVLRYGIRDARVEYNLGNATFKLHRLGEAILHYERALRMDPTDPDIKGNLALARSRCMDKVESQELSAPVGAILTIQDRLGPDRQAIAFLVLVWLVVGVVVWCSARPGGWNASAGWAVSSLVVAGCVLALSWYTTYERLEGAQRAVVLRNAVEVLAGPSPQNAALFTVHEGFTLEVRAERQEWLQVSLPNGLSGWVPREALGVV